MTKPHTVNSVEGHAFLAHAFNAISDGVLVYDTDHIIRHMNSAFTRFTKEFDVEIHEGMTRAELIGAFIDKGDWKTGNYTREELIEMQIKAGKDLNQNNSEHISTKSGKHFLRRTRPIEDGGEIVTLTDVTDIKDAQKKAEIAEKSKSEFLANMSHEIRTPLNGILGMTELLAGCDIGEREKGFVEIIQRSGNSLLTIINDILDFSKIAAGQLQLEEEPFNLQESLEDVTSLLASAATDKKVELLVRMQPDLPKFYVGDAGRIRQIFINLVGNAIKFTSDGYVLVNVKGQSDGTSVSFEIDVKDTGIGIPGDKLEHIFKQFAQVDASTTRKYGGTGLGLSIVSSLSRLMGGDVSVKSVVDEGTVFTVRFTLPVHSDLEEEKTIQYDVSDTHILVIDDNLINLRILKEQATSWGAKALPVNTAEKGLNVLKKAQEKNVNIDLVIVDFHMPEINGEGFVSLMFKDPAFKNIPVIMLSSIDQKELEDRMSNFGIADFLTKPIRSTSLRNAVGKALSRKPEPLETLPPQPVSPKPVESDTAAPVTVTPIVTQPVTIQPLQPQPVAPVTNASPVYGEQAAVTDTYTPVRPVQQATVNDAAKIDVLIAEDNDVNQMYISYIMEDLGLTFEIAKDGVEVVEMWEDLQPTLILMDISMPRANGYEATAAIRARTTELGLQPTPIIALTAHCLDGDRERAFENGLDDFLTKPIAINLLKKALRRWGVDLQEDLAQSA